jgi:hypothetical protein
VCLVESADCGAAGAGRGCFPAGAGAALTPGSSGRRDDDGPALAGRPVGQGLRPARMRSPSQPWSDPWSGRPRGLSRVCTLAAAQCSRRSMCRWPVPAPISRAVRTGRPAWAITMPKGSTEYPGRNPFVCFRHHSETQRATRQAQHPDTIEVWRTTAGGRCSSPAPAARTCSRRTEPTSAAPSPRSPLPAGAARTAGPRRRAGRRHGGASRLRPASGPGPPPRRRCPAGRPDRPAHLVIFDVLDTADGPLLDEPYRVRRARLDALFAEEVLAAPFVLCPATPTGRPPRTDSTRHGARPASRASS